MNNLSFKCNISLSKKLRALLGGKGSLILMISELVDGRGEGKLSVVSENEAYDSSLFNNETAIMITPLEQITEMPEGFGVASIFTAIPEKGKEGKLVKKLAAVHAPEKGEEQHAIIPKKKIKPPKQFPELEEKECVEYIKNYEELIDAITVAKNKVSNISLEGITNPRELAIRKEEKEKEEAIDTPAYIINNKYASLTINDLDLSLNLNQPFDLSNISAKRIASSKDLKSLLKSGIVKFISSAERDKYIGKDVDDDSIGSLEVFDSPEEAEDNMVRAEKDDADDEGINITEEDLDEPTEEQTIINLTKIPVKKTEGSVTKTTHGSSRQTRPPSSKPSTFKPISKKD